MSSRNRVRFGINLDLELLAYVRSENPFQDAMQWTNIASKMQGIAGRSFTVRAVRDRTELLLGRYAANDRASLNKSGTEEQYQAREVLLQEVLDLAREHGVKLRARRRAYPAPAATPGEANCAPAVQNSPAQARDIYAAAHFDGSAGDGDDQSESASQTFNQILSCDLNDNDTEDVAIQNLDDQTGTLQLPGRDTSPACPYTGQAEATAPAPRPAVRGASGWKRWWSRPPTARYCIDGANDHDRW
ncbi:hypothetical protein V5799_020377 [Amblyomma americanum]|uniref:Uncharacterized protein n=1 Tax=Amblyomma americanum TaxID=6943 RepID=A0AAQ4EUB8_AMBAM